MLNLEVGSSSVPERILTSVSFPESTRRFRQGLRRELRSPWIRRDVKWGSLLARGWSSCLLIMPSLATEGLRRFQWEIEHGLAYLLVGLCSKVKLSGWWLSWELYRISGDVVDLQEDMGNLHACVCDCLIYISVPLKQWHCATKVLCPQGMTIDNSYVAPQQDCNVPRTISLSFVAFRK